MRDDYKLKVSLELSGSYNSENNSRGQCTEIRKVHRASTTVEPLLSGHLLLSGQLANSRAWPLNRDSTVVYTARISLSNEGWL